jgi:hypothetical protein
VVTGAAAVGGLVVLGAAIAVVRRRRARNTAAFRVVEAPSQEVNDARAGDDEESAGAAAAGTARGTVTRAPMPALDADIAAPQPVGLSASYIRFESGEELLTARDVDSSAAGDSARGQGGRWPWQGSKLNTDQSGMV